MDAYFGQISFMSTPLHGEGLCKFHSLVNSLGPNIMFQLTTDMTVSSKYLFPFGCLINQKHAMRKVANKPHGTNMCKHDTRLTELIIFLPMFPGLYGSNKMDGDELNEILPRSFPNGGGKKSYTRGFIFESETYRYTTNLFELMEASEYIYVVIV